MNNLERIKSAWGMGWSATVKTRDGEGQAIRLTKSAILVLRPNYGPLELWEGYQLEITGFLYGGQLCGNEPIPEGQRFRVKETGEIIIKGKQRAGRNLAIYCNSRTYYKEELEPVFD